MMMAVKGESTITNIDSFLSLKLKQLSSMFNKEGSVIFRNFYNEIKNENLKEIFSTFHYNFNELFSCMNERKRPDGGHYKADSSRELIELTKQLRLIQATLREDFSEFSFELDDNYKKILDRCKTFLSEKWW